jgi:hypothetical protein
MPLRRLVRHLPTFMGRGGPATATFAARPGRASHARKRWSAAAALASALAAFGIAAAPPAPGTGLTAAPPSVVGFTVNGGAASTPNRVVQLAWTLSGPAATHFRVSETASFPNQAWNPMPQALPWNWTIASAGEGGKTIHVQFMNSYGQSEVRSATIELRIPPAVSSVTIEGGAAATAKHRVNVRFTTNGVYTHYRVGTAGYGALPWVAGGVPPANGVDVDLFNTTTADQSTAVVYVQLKRDNDAPVTAQQTIRFEPPLVDVVLDRQAASTWMNAAGVTTQLLAGQGTCQRKWNDFDGLHYLAATSVAPIGPRCGFKLFQNQTLRGRWTLKAVKLHLGLWLPPGMVALGDKKQPSSTCRFVAPPALGTNRMAMTIEVVHPGDAVNPGDSDHETFCLIESITLNGPQASGTTW